ncbi:unnamed protein product [Mytilus edulis]|uniref:Uncharacterized protein n=1 Tax=Mytilus edulis TaxID=6550 RepID=A0A8S3SNE1_MYTED|nr:unnamed protein product [Mytilus edulis]
MVRCTEKRGASYHNQAPVSLCAGKEVTTNFVYGDSAVKFINLTVINWTVRKTKQDTAEIFSYYNKAAGFKGQHAEGKTVKRIRVCPKKETNYTCCVDAMKTKCSSFTAQAGNIKRGRRTLAELKEENLILDNERLREETKRIKLEQENLKLANEVFILKKQSSICKLQSEFPDCVHEP